MREFSRRMRRASGHSISVNCFYDTIEAGEEFDRNFQIVSRDFHGDAYVMIKTNGANISDSSELVEVIDYDTYGEMYDEEYETSYKYIANNWWPVQIVPIISNVCTLNEVSNACLMPDEQPFGDWGEFEEWIKEQDEYGDTDYDWLWDTLPGKARDAVYEEAKKNVVIVDFEHIFDRINFWKGGDFSDIGLALKPGWTWYKSRGYSQGDACIVICSTDSDTDEIDRICWDVPVYCMVKIDGQVIYVDSLMKDRYTYDKDEVIEIIKGIMGDEYDAGMDELLQAKIPDQPKNL